MKYIFSIISLAFFLSPLSISYYYAYDQDIFKLIGYSTSLLMLILSVLCLASRFKNQMLRFFVVFFLSMFLIIIELMNLVSFYLQGEGFNERFFFHFNIDTLKNAGTAYPGLLIVVVMFFLFIIVFSKVISTKEWLKKLPIYMILPLLFTTTFLGSSVSEIINFYSGNFQADQALSIEEIKKRINSEAKQSELNISALERSKQQISSGKNLVLIYLESLEQIYTDNNVFAALTPNINNLMNNGLIFPNIEQTLGTGWTIAGTVASQCGTPLLAVKGQLAGNQIMKKGFLNKAVCLGDILHKAGYTQTFMGGAKGEFAGKSRFYRDHDFDKVLGLDELKGKLKDQKYQNTWGLFDDTLFEMAAKEYFLLASSGEAFNLTLLTLDTHRPGFQSKSCIQYGPRNNSMLNAIHCTDQLLEKFIYKIKQHPSYKNTVVVIMSDHLAMRNVTDKYYPEDYDRKLLVTVLNSKVKGKIETHGAHMDIAPTILDLLNIVYEPGFLLGKSLVKPAVNKPININSSDYSLVRNINSNYFSASATVCNSKLAWNSNHTIGFGEDDFFIQPSVGRSHVFKVDQNGFIKSSMSINNNALINKIEENNKNYLLIITDSGELISNLSVKPKNKYHVIFINGQKEFLYLGGSETLEEINIEMDCDKIMGFHGGDKIELKLPLDKNKHCNVDSTTPYFNSKDNKLIIPMIRLLDQSLEAVLIRRDNSFRAKSYGYISGPKNLESKRCMAQVFDRELFFPVILVDDQIHYNVTMTQASDGPGAALIFVTEHDAFN